MILIVVGGTIPTLNDGEGISFKKYQKNSTKFYWLDYSKIKAL